MSDDGTSTTIYHLEMCDRRTFDRKPAPAGFEAVQASPAKAEFNRHMYQAVGGPWDWTDRLVWSAADWEHYVCRDALVTFRGEFNGKTAGYFELEMQDRGNVEIVYFGLLPEYVGQGLGGPFLTMAVEQAWSLAGTHRVWVHTCTQDHPFALANYLSRGFLLFKTEQA
jgi:GNAT superfamily N-acetyltransferase